MRWLSFVIAAGAVIPAAYVIFNGPGGWIPAGAAAVAAWAAWILTGVPGRAGQWFGAVGVWCVTAAAVWAPIEGSVWVPWWDRTVDAWLVVVAGSVWVALAAVAHLPPSDERGDVEDEPEPQPQPRPRAVDRTPEPGPFVSVPPRVERVKAPTLVRLGDEPADAGAPFDPSADLAGRVAAAWDGTKSVMHLDELAERMDRDKTLLTLDLEEAGVPVDPRAGKKVQGRSVTKAGVRREAFDEWRQSLTTS